MGILKGRTEDYGSPLAGLPARLYAGYGFLHAGLQKASGSFGGEALQKTLTEWAGRPRYGFYLPFLTKVAIPHASIFVFLVTYGEIAIGVALLCGCASRLAALGGLFLCLNVLFASGASILGGDPPAVFALLAVTVYATAAGRALGLDYFLRGKLPRWVA